MLLCLTANHRNASFDLLDRLSSEAPKAASSLLDIDSNITGAIVLATCNRFEAYLDVLEPDGASVDTALRLMSSASSVSEDDLRSTISVLSNTDVARHLFAVSCGLESVVVGEDEISGQVQRALTSARQAKTVTPALDGMFQKAVATSRSVKTSTSLGGAGRSMVRLALELAGSRIADWAETRALIVGTGNYAATTVTALRDQGVLDIRVFSPTGRGSQFGLKHSVRFESNLTEAIADADLVIACSTGLTILPEHLGTPGRRLVIDLGLPRNVDPAVSRLAELLDLETISLHAPLEELSATTDARHIVIRSADEFEADRLVAPAIVALRRHVFDLLDAEILRARGRGDSSEETERALRHLASVLLHTPSERARELALNGRADDVVAGMEAIFGIHSVLGSVATNESSNEQTA